MLRVHVLLSLVTALPLSNKSVFNKQVFDKTAIVAGPLVQLIMGNDVVVKEDDDDSAVQEKLVVSLLFLFEGK